MANPEEGLKLGAELSMIALWFSIIFMIAGIIWSVYSQLNLGSMNLFNKNVNEFSAYENKTVKGDMVQSFIDNYEESMFIRVATIKNPIGDFGAALETTKDVDSDLYINPINLFHCTMLKDLNGNIIGASFEQEGITLSESEMTDAITQYKQALGV